MLIRTTNQIALKKIGSRYVTYTALTSILGASRSLLTFSPFSPDSRTSWPLPQPTTAPQTPRSSRSSACISSLLCRLARSARYLVRPASYFYPSVGPKACYLRPDTIVLKSRSFHKPQQHRRWTWNTSVVAVLRSRCPKGCKGIPRYTTNDSAAACSGR